MRLALGASKGTVLQHVLRHGTRLALAGIALGVAGALAVSKVMANLLYEVSASDPLTYVAVAGVLAMVAVLACYIPARRAAATDPMVALRAE